jgi:dihydroxyacetone kinase
MLTCAVCGDIFSSPSCANIIKAIEKIYCDAGVIIIVKNYTGDVINFSLACELFKSQNKKVEMIIVDDDISLQNLNTCDNTNQQQTFNKRRGLCGTVLLYKVLGYLSTQGKTFEDILTAAKAIIPSLYTVGVSLTTCIPPFTSITSDDVIPQNEYELGLGIHGEKGKERHTYTTVNDVIQAMFTECFEKNICKDVYANMKNVVIIVNNLGALTPIEMNIIIKAVFDYGINKFNILRIIHGNLMTSLDMKGFSLTLCNLNQINNIDIHELMLKGIDDPIIETPSLYWSVIKDPKCVYENVVQKRNESVVYDDIVNKNEVDIKEDTSLTRKILNEMFVYLKTKVDYLNNLDKKVGDGDIGTGVLNAILKAESSMKYLNFKSNLNNSLKQIAEDIGSGFGGTSGPLYMSFLLRGSNFIKNNESDNSVNDFMTALNEGAKMIMKVGKANVGDRTMVDYLIPLSEAMLNNVNTIEDVKEVFNKKRIELLETVKNMKSKRGRSSYLEGKEIGMDEPGCVLCDLWLGFIFDKL